VLIIWHLILGTGLKPACDTGSYSRNNDLTGDKIRCRQRHGIAEMLFSSIKNVNNGYGFRN